MTSQHQNPEFKLPEFSQIKPAEIPARLDELLSQAQGVVDRLSEMAEPPTWENFLLPLSEANEAIELFWSPVSHLNAVVNNDAIREAYNGGLPKLSAFSTELGQNAGLYQRYKALRNSADEHGLDEAQKRIIDNAITDFELSGVALADEPKARFKEIQLRLSKLSSQFQDNLLDATNDWQWHIEEEALLSGLPDFAKGMAQQFAKSKDLSGWLLRLEIPLYLAVMTYADNRDVREKLHRAFVTRASDQAEGEATQWDNQHIIRELLELRQEKAKILGLKTYADVSLAKKMADTPNEVIAFLEQLLSVSKPAADKEFTALQAFAKAQGLDGELQAWDLPYYGEKLKQAEYAISDEALKPYFPAPRVVNGLFEITQKLFGVEVVEVETFNSYHNDVQLFEIRDGQSQSPIGRFYLDLFARENKRGGAWMAPCVDRKETAKGVTAPIAFLTCNLTPPVGDDPALLTHQEVTTLFHEFGHGLHHMLTQVKYSEVSGINGVEWDAVELPSQFLENWCWEKEGLDIIAGHYQTGEPLPSELLEKARKAKNFQSAMMMVRQLEFSLFDMQLHMTPGADARDVLQSVRDRVAVTQPPAFNRFENSFSHIFAGGYAAGYYSYKWAEVLSADAFSRFEQDGLFNQDTGREFKQAVLEVGGTRAAKTSFKAFMHREPSVDALLRHNGLTQAA